MKRFGYIFSFLKHKTATILGAGILITACTVNIPSDIIQPDKMENLLYDYHLAQAISADLPSTEKYKKELYEQYILKKHQITEAEFDSSLMWYMRHTKELSAIYENLNKRFTKNKEFLAAHSKPGEYIHEISQKGDSINVWIANRLYRLTDSQLSNKLIFRIPSDSNFHIYDTFIWKLTADYLGQPNGAQAVMALSLLFNNDSTIGITQNITQSGTHVLTLQCDSNYQLKEIAGYIYYFQPLDITKSDTIKSKYRNIAPTLLLTDISLLRYHCKDSILLNKEESNSKDSIALKDSIKISKELKN